MPDNNIFEIHKTLKAREKTYGDFSEVAFIAQHLKEAMQLSRKYGELKLTHAEALDMIMTKIARILNGNADHADNWHDIAGYATLAEQRCKPE